MRRKKLLIAIAALASLGPMPAQAANTSAGDRQIAQQIIERLKSNRESGALKDFKLDMKVDQGVVLFRGNVNGELQKQLVLEAAQGIDGIAEVVDQVQVAAATKVAAKPQIAPEVAAAPAKPASEMTQATPSAPTPSASATPDMVAAPVPASKEPASKKPASKEPASQQIAAGDSKASGFSFREALASEAKIVRSLSRQPEPVMAGVVQPVTALEESDYQQESVSDQEIVDYVVSALGRAKNAGQLKGFGVDVQCNDGVVQLNGQAASGQQRDTIVRIASRAPGISSVHQSIAIPAAAGQVQSEPIAAVAADPAALSNGQPVMLQPIQPLPLGNPQSAPARQVPAQFAAAPIQHPHNGQGFHHAGASHHRAASAAPAHGQVHTAPYRLQQQTHARPAGFGTHAAGTPVPIAPHAPVGAPRYDNPNLPNYAWPGYAAHPNYAAVTYPQQYSPSAWPYIGPFYPYPQVPLGWRKVSLEWDDGWWFLDFTDR